MRQWRYLYEKYEFFENTGWIWVSNDLRGLNIEDGLNRRGKEGWELVSVASDHFEGSTKSTHFYFKREA